MTTQAEDIDFSSPHAEAIIDRIAREKPWRWWPDYWFSYVFRRWPVFIYTTCFALAHYQYWMLALSVAALYADWKYLPRYAQDLRLSARELVVRIIKDEPIPSPIPKHWWAEIKRVYIVGGVVVLGTIVLMASFSGTIIADGLQRPASLLVAFEWYVLGIVSLVLMGYFWPTLTLKSRHDLEGSEHPTKTRLTLTATKGPVTPNYASMTFARLFTLAFTVFMGAAYFTHFDTYSRDYAGFPGQLKMETVFEFMFVTMVVGINIIIPSVIRYQTAARRFLSLYAKSDS